MICYYYSTPAMSILIHWGHTRTQFCPKLLRTTRKYVNITNRPACELLKESGWNSFCVFLPPEPFSFDLHSRLTLVVLLPLSHSITNDNDGGGWTAGRAAALGGWSTECIASHPQPTRRYKGISKTRRRGDSTIRCWCCVASDRYRFYTTGII